MVIDVVFFCSSRRRHTRCALVTGVQTCALPISTRRASPLSDVPIAVSDVTGETLRNSGASDIRQLNQLAPSLLVSSSGTESNGAARIRGIGTVGYTPGLESSVAVFIDGVSRSRPGEIGRAPCREAEGQYV